MTIESTNEYVLPSNPKDRKAIKDGIEEIKVQLITIKSANEHIKAIQERLKEELELPPKVAKKMATISLKDDEKGNEFEKQSIEHESFEIAYQTLFREGDSVEDDSEQD